MLTINTLGYFQITDQSNIFGEEDMNSVMLTKLFMFLLLHRDKTLTIEEIGAAIWQEEEIENPAGALKNLMYRLRKTLSKSFPDIEFIITNRGAYKWNNDTLVILDIEEFERLINEAKADNVYEDAMRKYEQAIAIYQGDFMPKFTDLHWIMMLNTYYHSMFVSAIKALAELYVKYDRYDDLENISSIALQYESSDEQLYCYQIEARMRSGNISLALESYEKARSIMEKELGIRKTAILNKVYEELLSMSKGQVSYNINEIHDDIIEDDPQGVFLCGYPIFKEIYHLEARKSVRGKDPENLLLLTLETRNDDPRELTEFRIKQTMAALEQTLKECLRVGDVAAKYSDTQFIILLPTCTHELTLLVANRIISKLYDKGEKYKNIKVRINIEEVSMGGDLVD